MMDYFYEDNRLYVLDDFLMLSAEVLYPQIDDSTVDLKRVYVSPILRGKGVASEVMLEAYKTIKNKGFKVVPTCSYAIVWFKRHPEYQDILVDKKTLNKSS
jgi:hypothetical protein